MSDLISREALKQAIFIDEPISIDETWEQLYDAVVKAINNAPTVEPDCGKHDEAIIRCKDCKHQKKWWCVDNRMKDKGYFIYGCNLIDDSFVGTPVWGENNQFCSSAEPKGGADTEQEASK